MWESHVEIWESHVEIWESHVEIWESHVDVVLLEVAQSVCVTPGVQKALFTSCAPGPGNSEIWVSDLLPPKWRQFTKFELVWPFVDGKKAVQMLDVACPQVVMMEVPRCQHEMVQARQPPWLQQVPPAYSRMKSLLRVYQPREGTSCWRLVAKNLWASWMNYIGNTHDCHVSVMWVSCDCHVWN